MRFTDVCAFYLLGLAAGSAISARDPPEKDEDGIEAPGGDDDKGGKHPGWPKTKSPHFFELRVVDDCYYWDHDHHHGKGKGKGGKGGGKKRELSLRSPPEEPCLGGLVVRLDRGVAYATPYKKHINPPPPIFFVDDDTQFYTVSRQPLQLYVDQVGGGLRYTKLGWLPPNAIGISFYHTGNNPLREIDYEEGSDGYSPSLLTWPSTPGVTKDDGKWRFCPNGKTGQYNIYVNKRNFDPQDDTTHECFTRQLGALNADPWKKKKHHGGKHGGNGYGGYGDGDDYD